MSPSDAPGRPAAGPSSGPAAGRLVCRCLGVSSLAIARVLSTGAAPDLNGVGRATRAGTGCGTCRPEIAEVLDDLAGRPVSDARRRRNRAICQLETEKRVETAVYLGVAGELPPPARLEILAVRGLRVDLYLHPSEEAVRALITAELRKLVCSDLDVQFV